MPDEFEGGLPASIQTEITVLGAASAWPDATRELLDRLTADDFLLDSHQRIYRAIAAVAAKGISVDLITLIDHLRATKELESIGSEAYLMHIQQGIPYRFDITSYAKILKDKAQLRRIFHEAEALRHEAADASEDSGILLDRARDRFNTLAENDDKHEIQTVGQYLKAQGPPESMFESFSTGDGIPFGFDMLDEALGSGAQNGDLIIVAARPSMGKTAWACNVAQHNALVSNKNAVLFTLEEKGKNMIRRMLSSSSRIDHTNIQRNKLRPEDRDILLEHRARLAMAPLFLYDGTGTTATSIVTKCSRLKRTEGLDIAYIDQLSHVDPRDVRGKGMPKHEYIGLQTKKLKRMARELDIPVVVFNQLGRESAKRSDPTPTLADLKESGSIEEDADVVIFLHRPEYYDRKDEDLKGKGQMIIAKQRNGPTKTVSCTYNGDIMRWENKATKSAQQASLPDEGYYTDIPPISSYEQR